MEGKHEFVLKKAVAMFNKLTGKKMTTKEGGTFLDIYDLVHEHTTNAAPAEPTPWEQATSETAAEVLTTERAPGPVNLEIPAFIGREVEKAVAPAPEQPQSAVAVLEEAMSRDTVFELVEATKDSAPAEEPAPIAPEPKTPRFTFEPAKEKYAPPPIRTQERQHIPGYDWQILVLDRNRNPDDSYIMHYAEKPKQAQFDEHYALFDARTHYVHLNEKRGRDWVAITDNYAPFFYKPAPKPEPAPRIVHEAKAPEQDLELVGRDVSQPAISAPWEQPDMAFRIRYHSDVMGRVTFHYVDKKPSRAEMAHFHHTKCLAAVQARPTEVSA